VELRAKFVVSVMSNYTNMGNTKFSRAVLNELCLYEVMSVAVLLLKSNKLAGNDLQQNTTVSAQGTYVGLHTSYPYGNSDRCYPTEGTELVKVKVFTVRNLSAIRRSNIYTGYIDKNFHICPFTVYVRTMFPLVYPPKLVRYNDSYNQTVYEDGFESEMIKVIGNALNVIGYCEFWDVLVIVIAEGARGLKELKANHLYLSDGFLR
jgi:hypothetical protein